MCRASRGGGIPLDPAVRMRELTAAAAVGVAAGQRTWSPSTRRSFALGFRGGRASGAHPDHPLRRAVFPGRGPGTFIGASWARRDGAAGLHGRRNFDHGLLLPCCRSSRRYFERAGSCPATLVGHPTVEERLVDRGRLVLPWPHGIGGSTDTAALRAGCRWSAASRSAGPAAVRDLQKPQCPGRPLPGH